MSLVDTAGAYPGIGAEERGQAEAIARSTDRCLSLGVPLIAVVIGEGGSGGAVAIATANRVLMLEHAIYTVVSPEAAASILWRDSARAIDAATSMKITAPGPQGPGRHRRRHPEPVGGAHRDPAMILKRTGDAITKAFGDFAGMSPEAIRRQRHEKFLAIGRNSARATRSPARFDAPVPAFTQRGISGRRMRRLRQTGAPFTPARGIPSLSRC